MDVFAAVMTGPGTGAIATIGLLGDAAEAVLREVFQRKSGRAFELAEGRVLFGRVVDDGATIDEVTIGCEGPGNFAIHCHGNPLIVERIMGLLQRRGVQPVPAEQLLTRLLTIQEPVNAIRREAKLALTTVKTIEGATLIANQVKAGLSQRAGQWREHLHSISLAQIAADARQILEDSEPARLVISGCTVALVGPPNTGKSTFLNALAGREKAIVTDMPGTTRDWVCAEIHIPPLAATVIDTAGLDATLAAAGGDIDRTAQRKSMEILERADLIVLVLDLSRPAEPSLGAIVERLTGRRTIVVLNKADLPHKFDPAALPVHLPQAIHISAQCGTGIEDLICAIHRVCGLTDFSFATPVAFTDRQTRLLERLVHSDSPTTAQSIIAELLEGPPAG